MIIMQCNKIQKYLNSIKIGEWDKIFIILLFLF